MVSMTIACGWPAIGGSRRRSHLAEALDPAPAMAKQPHGAE